jgi:hypothetical protein
MYTYKQPFNSDKLEKIYDNIVNLSIDWNLLEESIGGDKNAYDLIKNFLILEPEKRLTDYVKIKNHPYFDDIDWNILSRNVNAIDLLEKNQDKINWFALSLNTSIFIETYDYDLIRSNFKDLGEEIVIKALHPKRMLRLMNEYGEDEIYKCYFDEEFI